jgi:hypothetical protein
VIDPAGYCVGLAVGEGHGKILEEMVGELLQIASGTNGKNKENPTVLTEFLNRLPPSGQLALIRGS